MAQNSEKLTSLFDRHRLIIGWNFKGLDSFDLEITQKLTVFPLLVAISDILSQEPVYVVQLSFQAAHH
jgi:hypothetical protein